MTIQEGERICPDRSEQRCRHRKVIDNCIFTCILHSFYV